MKSARSTSSKPRRVNDRKTTSGNQALQSMFKHSKDYIIKAASTRYTGRSAPLNIAHDLRVLSSMLNTEDKFINTLQTSSAVTSGSPLIYGIGTVSQGTTQNQRTGDSIKINKIDLIIQFYFSQGTLATSGIATQVFNYYLVKYNKTPSTSGTSSFAISEFIDADANGAYTALSFPNSDTNQNFTILSSGQVQLEVMALSATSTPIYSKLVQLSIPTSYHQTYNGASNTAITDNMTFVVVTALTAANAGGTSSVSIQSKMWFIDN
jgi:hypothetical protein